jgi:hypothetical protein
MLRNRVHVLLMYTSVLLNKQADKMMKYKWNIQLTVGEQYKNAMISPVLNIRLNTGILNAS